MLIPVQFNEIAGQNILSFDLYDGKGIRLFQSGAILEHCDLHELRELALYRQSDALPIDHEGTEYSDFGKLTVAEKQERLIEDTTNIYGDETAGSLIYAIRHFIAGMERGATPDIALCELIRDKLVAEVTSKVDQIHYLGQIRVRDKFTYSHILDVTAVSIALAMKAGFDKQDVRDIALAAVLHDLGKLLIPKAIMFKPTRLTEKEFEVMKLHPALGYKIIKEELRLPDHIALPALEHQEMYSGGGYPQGLKGDEIHPLSQIVKIADVYDALTSKRPYKESIPSSRAIKIMLSEGEKSFNPELLAHFVEMANYHEEARYQLAVS